MIKILSEEIWARIAAGEVVERPASAVKELVENSLDVGARRVRVSLWDGGKSRIVVEDDGAGIPFDELPLAVAQHATSKLQTIDDLNAILTLGYRGEALASVAAVSEFEIRSRFGDEDGGLLRVCEGKIIEHIKTGCAAGTRIQVSKLFFNLPARQKFLRTPISELRKVNGVVRDYALAWAGVSFALSHDGKQIFMTDGNGQRERTLVQLWGASPSHRMVQASSGNLSLECWHQPFPGRGRNEVSAFVNGRSVNDPLIRGAVGNFGKEINGNWALFFTINPSLIDVNIHPAKAEIRFRHTGEVFDAVKQAAEILSGNSSLKISDTWHKTRDINSSASQNRKTFSNNFRIEREESLFSRVAPLDTEDFAKAPLSEGGCPEGAGGREFSEVNFLAQTSRGYLIFETKDAVVLMDPHAAHERIMFEKIRASGKQNLTSQKLIAPEPLPPTLSLEVREHEKKLRMFGFVFEESGEGGGEFCVSAVPGALKNLPALQLLRTAISAFNEGGDSVEELLAARWAVAACKASVKLTQNLHALEAISLWQDLKKCAQPFECPHGRPTLLEISGGELTKHFGRSEA